MKNKVIRLSSGVLLTALVSVSLVACGSKKDESSTASNKTASSVVAKSSSTKKASQSSSKAQSSSSQAGTQAASQSEQGSSANAAGSQEQGNASQGTGQTNDFSDKETETSDAAVPTELVGTWTGSSQQASEITMTIGAAGNVTTTANFNVDYEPNRTSSTTAKAVQVGDNLYVWEGGDYSTLLPGITGLGGAGGQVKVGFILTNGQYTPVDFVTGIGEEFDYSNYRTFQTTLTKQ